MREKKEFIIVFLGVTTHLNKRSCTRLYPFVSPPVVPSVAPSVVPSVAPSVVLVVSPGAVGAWKATMGEGTAVIVARDEKLGRVRRKLTAMTGLTHKSLVVSPVGLASQEKRWFTVCR